MGGATTFACKSQEWHWQDWYISSFFLHGNWYGWDYHIQKKSFMDLEVLCITMTTLLEFFKNLFSWDVTGAILHVCARFRSNLSTNGDGVREWGHKDYCLYGMIVVTNLFHRHPDFHRFCISRQNFPCCMNLHVLYITTLLNSKWQKFSCN